MKRTYHRKVKSGKWRKIKTTLKLLGAAFLLSVLAVAFVFLYYAKDLPRPEQFRERDFPESTKIYDRTGEILLYKVYGEEKRTVIPLEEMPQSLKHAVVAAEDARFYKHIGIDVEGITRATWLNIKRRELLYGGSTITQQLIRSTFFTTEKTAKRKVREIILSLELDRRYSKDQILEWYLNQVPFGANAYGVEAAAQTFFDKKASELNLSESATLAALIRAPSYLSPYGKYKDELMNRKNYILDRMAEEHFITKEEADQAKKEELKFAGGFQSIEAPHFVMYILDQLRDKYGRDLSFLEQRGLKIYTSLDWELQQKAEEAVEKGAEENEIFNASNGALLAIDPNTGEILAMVGSKDYFNKEEEGNVNNCLRLHQPGSSFKPFVYATAFKKGYSATTTVVDERTNFGVWGGEEYIPENYDGIYRGEVTLRKGLAQSLNVASVKVFLNLAGIEESVETAKKLGIKSDLPKVPSLVLGGGEVKLLNMVSAYGAFATEGLRVPPVSILSIKDQEGNVIEENNKSPRRVLSEKVARTITSILSDNEARAPMFGENSNLYIKGADVAAKTGTTDDFRDAWTIGYTSDIVAGVWAGNNDNSKMAEKPAVVIAGSIWRDFMEEAINR